MHSNRGGRKWLGAILGILRRVLLVAVALAAVQAPCHAHAVNDWNKIALETAENAGNPAQAAHTMAMVHVAMLEVLNFIQGSYTPEFLVASSTSLPVSQEAAAAVAAHYMLVQLYPGQEARFDAALNTSLEALEEERVRVSGGVIQARGLAPIIHAIRSPYEAKLSGLDALSDTATLYVSNGSRDRSIWQGVQPWVIESRAQFRQLQTPATRTSRGRNEVDPFGGLHSRRTAEQTDPELRRFWAALGPLSWNPVVEQLAQAGQLSLIRTARIHALVSMVIVDAYVAALDAQANRPAPPRLAAIPVSHTPEQRGADPVSLGDASSNSDYPCASCAASEAVSVVLQSEFGSGDLSEFGLTSSAVPGAKRQWRRIADCAGEASQAQMRSGAYDTGSISAGREIGRAIARYALLRYYKPR